MTDVKGRSGHEEEYVTWYISVEAKLTVEGLTFTHRMPGPDQIIHDVCLISSWKQLRTCKESTPLT